MFIFFLNYWLLLFNSSTYYADFNVAIELVISTGIPTKDAKAEIETHLVSVEAKISKCLL